MVRPRFLKLPPHQQQVILCAALDEFATHGFHDASLNRVIEAAQISKGSMYYYFDGKADLFSHVALTELTQLLAQVGELPQLDGGGANKFWSVLEDYYLDLVCALSASPTLAAFLRGWSSATKSPAFQKAQSAMEQESVPWIEKVLHVGQRVGAVRDDLPDSLMIAVVLGMGEAMDIWLVSHHPDEKELPDLIGALIGMMRGAVGVQPASEGRR